MSLLRQTLGDAGGRGGSCENGMLQGLAVNVCQYDSIIQYEPVDTCGLDDFDCRH